LIFLSRERGLLWLRHEPLQSMALRFGTNSFLLLDSLYYQPSASFGLSRLPSSLWVSRTGSASDWCALQEALYKCTDTIQYNKIHPLLPESPDRRQVLLYIFLVSEYGPIYQTC